MNRCYPILTKSYHRIHHLESVFKLVICRLINNFFLMLLFRCKDLNQVHLIEFHALILHINQFNFVLLGVTLPLGSFTLKGICK
jgi:hypothetical protein